MGKRTERRPNLEYIFPRSAGVVVALIPSSNRNLIALRSYERRLAGRRTHERAS